MKTMRGVVACGLVGAAFGIGATGAVGQSESTEPKIGCFRGQQLDACRSFWIFEMQGSVSLAETDRYIEHEDGNRFPVEGVDEVLEWNLGHMVNVSQNWAVGGILTVGSGNSDLLTGIKLRARRWLHPDLSVELEGGVWRTDAGGIRWPGSNGGTADLRLNIRDQGSLYVRWDGINVPEDSFGGFVGGGGAYFLPGGFHQSVSIGASAGSVPGLVGTGALGLAYVILLGLYLGYD